MTTETTTAPVAPVTAQAAARARKAERIAQNRANKAIAKAKIAADKAARKSGTAPKGATVKPRKGTSDVARAAREAARGKPQHKPGQVVPPPAPRDADWKRIKRIGDQKHDLTRYETVIAASGNTSLDCGDPLAAALRGKSLDDVYKAAAKELREPEADLRKRYAHLNPGMQRMNLGNRMRAARE